MEANGLMEDEYSPDWLEDRINALAHLLGAAETDSPNGAAGNPFKPYFSLLLYNGGLALLKQDVAPMARRLEELSTALPGIDVLHVLCHVRQQCCGCTRTFKQGQPRINSFASRSLIAISTHEVPRLLYTPDAVSSVQAAADKLVAIYPYRYLMLCHCLLASAAITAELGVPMRHQHNDQSLQAVETISPAGMLLSGKQETNLFYTCKESSLAGTYLHVFAGED
eukprot:scaffold168303_cov18-Tisochrysis_lutea.AAC.2